MQSFIDMMTSLFYTVFAMSYIPKDGIPPMSHQERASVVGIVIGLVLNGYVSVRLWQLFGSGALSGEDAPMVWAQAIVWVIPAAVAIAIVSSILFAIAAKDSKRNAITDERDRLFQYRGMCVTLIAIAFGFIGMVVALAVGWSAVVGLTLLYASAAIGDLLGQTVRLASYRIGG